MPTHFSHKDLEHLKRLCRMQLSPDEDADILSSLQKILGYMDILHEIPTEGVATFAPVQQGMQARILRDDVATPPLPRDQFLANAPDQVGGMIKTPLVMKAP